MMLFCKSLSLTSTATLASISKSFDKVFNSFLNGILPRECQFALRIRQVIIQKNVHNTYIYIQFQRFFAFFLIHQRYRTNQDQMQEIFFHVTLKKKLLVVVLHVETVLINKMITK